MASWVGVVTNAGKSLFAAWVNGTTFNFDAAEGGSGTVAESALLAQTALTNKRQDISIIGSMRVEDGVKLTIQITAPASGYTLNQIGIKGSVDGGASALCALFQSTEGVTIPSVAQTPDFIYKFFATVQLSNTGTFTVSVDSSALVSHSELELAISSHNTGADTHADIRSLAAKAQSAADRAQSAIDNLDLSSYISDKEKGVANGVASLDSDGKVETEQLPKMDYIPLSEKGVANGVATLGGDGLVPAMQLPIIEALPRGMICMWSGAKDKIPTGWLLCDGTNGTPDLRGRFIIGAGGSYAVGETGGAESVALSINEMPSHTHAFSNGTAASAGAHTHTITSKSGSAGAHTHTVSGTAESAGAHTHTVGGASSTGSGGSNYYAALAVSNYRSLTIPSAGAHTHNITGTAASAGGHTHTITSTAANAGAHTHTVTGKNEHAGGGLAHENRPPYYALCFIMKN